MHEINERQVFLRYKQKIRTYMLLFNTMNNLLNDQEAGNFNKSILLSGLSLEPVTFLMIHSRNKVYLIRKHTQHRKLVALNKDSLMFILMCYSVVFGLEYIPVIINEGSRE